MNIVIVGCGFIGHHLATKLHGQGHKVATVDQNNIPYVRKNHMRDEIEFFRLEDGEWSDNFYNGVIVPYFKGEDADVFIQTAAESNAKKFAENFYVHSVYTMTGMAQEIMGHFPSGKSAQYIYLSSSMVYGNFGDDNPDENYPRKPIEPYGIMKSASEEILKHYANLWDMPYTIIRPSAVYGPGDRIDRVISKFIDIAGNNVDPILHINGTHLLDFTYIDDLVDGICLAVGNEKAYNETFNMTGDDPRTIINAAADVIKAFGKGSFIIEDHDKFYPVRGGLNNSKAKRILGYNPQTKLEEGIAKYVRLWERTVR